MSPVLHRMQESIEVMRSRLEMSSCENTNLCDMNLMLVVLFVLKSLPLTLGHRRRAGFEQVKSDVRSGSSW